MRSGETAVATAFVLLAAEIIAVPTSDGNTDAREALLPKMYMAEVCVSNLKGHFE